MATIHELIPKIMGEIQAVAKAHKNKEQGFMFRKAEDVINEMHPILKTHGVFLLPEVLSEVREERLTAANKRINYSILRIRYTFFAPDGSSVAVVMVGEGMDSGDKASPKAQTSGFKNALCQVFMIPFANPPDPDEESHEVAPKSEPKSEPESPAQKSGPQKKWAAAALPESQDPRLAAIDSLVTSFRKVGVSEKRLAARYNVADVLDLTDEMIEDARAVGRQIRDHKAKSTDYF